MLTFFVWRDDILLPDVLKESRKSSDTFVSYLSWQLDAKNPFFH